MGTSLSGLTPATTFDGLLKVGDNDPLTADLKAISTGDGTDTMLELSTSALQIGGTTGMYWDNTNKRLGIGTNAPSTTLQVNGSIRSSGSGTQIFEFSSASLAQFRAIFGSVGFRVGSGMFIGGTDGGPASSTRLHIKGSGASAGTTSLLVQNSAGANLLEVKDDKSVNIYSGLRINGVNVIDWDGGTNSTRYFYQSGTGNHKFYTNGGTQRMILNNDGDLGIGETTPTARLQVKGSGDDATTTALLVQNSDGDDMVKVTDDGGAIFKSFGASNSLILDASSGVSALEMQASNGVQRFRIQATSTSTRFTPNNTDGFTFVGSAIYTSGAFDTPSARLHIKGSGASAGTTALLVQNSAGTELLKVLDDGQFAIKSNSGGVSTTSGTSIFSYSSGGGGVLDVNPSNGNSVKFRARGDNDVYLIETNPANDAVGIGLTGATAKLQVKGSGNDATTTALLVQNSDTTPLDLFKILDDGTLVAPNLPTSATGLPTGAIYNDAGTLKIV